MNRKVTAIVQARTGATRLPGKVFLPLSEQPLIWHVFNRLSFSTHIDECVLATTNNRGDDMLEQWAKKNGITCYRGSEENVLERYYKAAATVHADVIVRITADDPFKDPEVIDTVIEKFFAQQLDFAYNNHPPSYPEGLDVEVFGFAALEKAHLQSVDAFEREHVTQYFYRNPLLFRQQNHSYKDNISYLRWTLDTAEDYAMVKVVYEHLYEKGKIFLLKDILELLQQHPEISTMNSDVKRSAMYNQP